MITITTINNNIINNIYNGKGEKREKIETYKNNKRKTNQTKKNKKIEVQSNNVIIRYDPNNVYVNFCRIKYKYILYEYIYTSYIFITF